MTHPMIDLFEAEFGIFITGKSQDYIVKNILKFILRGGTTGSKSSKDK